MTGASLYQLYLVADRAHKLLDRAGVSRYTTELQSQPGSRWNGHVSVSSYSGQPIPEKVDALLAEEPELEVYVWGGNQMQVRLTTRQGIRLVIPFGHVDRDTIAQMIDNGIAITEE